MQATWCEHYTMKVVNLDLETDTENVGELCGVLGMLATRKYPSNLKQDLLIQHPQQYSKVLKNLQRRLRSKEEAKVKGVPSLLNQQSS